MSKLLMVTSLGSGIELASGRKGAFYHTLEEFHKHWERIDIILPKISGLPREQVLFGNVHIHVSPWPLLLHPIFFVRKALALHRQIHFDLMTVQEFPPFYNGIGSAIIHDRTGIPYMLEIHHIPGYPKASNLKELIYRYLSWRFLAADARDARAVRIVNQNQTKKFLLNAGVPESKIKYIPSMYLDLDIFKPAQTEKKYDLLSVARLEANKGTLELIKAVELLKKDRPEVSLAIVGEGSLKKSLEKYVREHNMAGNVHFLGWLNSAETLADAYRSAKVFVNPSRNEGGPRVALEAMACATPVVTTRVGLMLDIIWDHANGFFCGWSAKEMAKTLSEILADEKLLETRGRNGLEAVKQFERKSAITAYAEAIKKITKKRLLIITKTVDEHDQLLGFFIDWIRRLNDYVDVSLLCLEKGEYDLPKNISVVSMGKDRKESKLRQGLNFYHYIFSRSGDYDSVLVHMSPIWAALGGWFWRLSGKKLILWYTSGGVTFKLRAAAAFADVILTASKESFRLKSDKVIVTNHGIDTDLFKPDLNKKISDGTLRILGVGRISPTKNYDVLVRAAAILRDKGFKFSVDMIGEPALEKDKKYFENLKKEISDSGLDGYFNFLGKIDNKDLVPYYQSHDLFVHLSKTGSLDKTVLEAMSCGMNVVSSNDAVRGFLDESRIFNGDDPAELAAKIERNGNLPSGDLRQFVVEHHNLDNLIVKIASQA